MDVKMVRKEVKQVINKVLSILMVAVVLVSVAGFSTPAVRADDDHDQGVYYGDHDGENEDDENEEHEDYMMMDDSTPQVSMPVSVSVTTAHGGNGGMGGNEERRNDRHNETERRGHMGDNEGRRNEMERRGQKYREFNGEKRQRQEEFEDRFKRRSRFSFFGFFKRDRKDNERGSRGVRVQFKNIRRGIGQEIRKECKGLTGQERAQCVTKIAKEFRDEWLERVEERVNYLEEFANKSRVLTKDQRQQILEQVRQLKQILQDAKASNVDPKELREQIRTVRKVVRQIKQEVRNEAYVKARKRMERAVERAAKLLEKYDKYITDREQQVIERKLAQARGLAGQVTPQMPAEEFKAVVKEFRDVMVEVKKMIREAVLN